MKFDWDKFFECIMTLGGFAAAAVVLVFFLSAARGCHAVAKKEESVRQAAKAKVYQTCLERTNHPLECREALKDLY